MIAVAGAPAVKYLLLSGSIIGIEEATRFGIVTAVVDENELENTVTKLAKQIVGGAPLAARDHKIMIRRLSVNPDTETLSEDDFNLQFRIFDSVDFREGVEAFKEKRRPVFRGE